MTEFDPLGPEAPDPPADGSQSHRLAGLSAHSLNSQAIHSQVRKAASRIDAEVERLRTSPTPTKSFSSGANLMGIFSRTRDIIAANFSDLLDKADDPEKMIRMIIFEMEETLVEVRASAARTIADQKEMHRHTVKLDRLQADWGERAQLALSKDREDLARAALVEKKKAADMAEQLKVEITVLDDALRAYELDIEKLQTRLREARTRQSAIAARLEIRSASLATRLDARARRTTRPHHRPASPPHCSTREPRTPATTALQPAVSGASGAGVACRLRLGPGAVDQCWNAVSGVTLR